MPNYIKYSTTTPSGSLKKGNAALGITDEVTGPTSTTGWYSGINPPTGSYTIYEVAATGDPDIYCPINTTELLNLVKSKGATGGNTGSVAAALAWIATQNNLLATNEVYPNIITSGSVLMLDAGFVGSYPTTASTWYDVSGNNNGSLINGPVFNSNGAIVFDGVDDYVDINSFADILSKNAYTKTAWFYMNSFKYNIVSGGDAGMHAFWMAGTTKLSAGHNGAWYTVTSSAALFLNKWYFGAVTFSTSSGWNLYVNGNLEATNPNNATFGGTGGIYIGSYNAAANLWDGRIASVNVYNRVLSQAEINQNYYQGPIVTNDLVLAVDAGNLVSYESGSSLTYSLTGSNSGSLINGTGYSNINNGTWVFDGVDDAIAWPNNPLSSLTSITYECWFKFNNNFNNGFTISGPTLEVYLQAKNTWYTDRISRNNFSWTFNTNWNQLVFTYSSGAGASAYINGVSLTVNSGGGLSSQSNLWIGNRSNLDNGINGNIAITRVYSRVLTQSEIIQNFNAQKTRFGL